MEFRLDVIEHELLQLQKIELVWFIISRKLPERLQNNRGIVDFLLANESRCCCRCSNGHVVPITFYSSIAEGYCQNFIETQYDNKTQMGFLINSESTINENSCTWATSTNEPEVHCNLNVNATDGANEYSYTPPAPTNEATPFEPIFISTGPTNNVQDIQFEEGIVEESSNLETTSIKIEYPELKEEKCGASLEECDSLIENGQLKNVQDIQFEEGIVEESSNSESTSIKVEYTELDEEKYGATLDECDPLIENVDDTKPISGKKIKKIHQCEMCSYKTSTKMCLIKHQVTHSDERPFSCHSCSYKAKSRDRLKMHIATHGNRKKFSCNLCEFKCSTQYVLSDHMLSHTQEVEFVCSLCDYKTFQKRFFKFHMKTHGAFKCEICRNVFKSKAHLKTHILQYHTEDKPFKCDVCDYTCVSKHYLKRHNLSVHLREKKFSCEFCDHKCFSRTLLSVHRRIHTGEKPFECTQCNYKSTLKTILRVHMRTHTGEKPFSCDLCEYKTTFKPNVKRHIQRVHFGEMPFSCKMCDFKGKYHKDLKKHNTEAHDKNV